MDKISKINKSKQVSNDFKQRDKKEHKDRFKKFNGCNNNKLKKNAQKRRKKG